MIDEERRFIRGDEAAFERLVRAHARRAWRAAWRVVRTDTDAEEALQEAMVRAWRHRTRYRPGTDFGAWLATIAVRAALTIAGRRPPTAVGLDPDRIPARGADGPVAAVEAREVGRTVAAALDAMSPAQRAAIVIVDLEDRPLAEAAEALGCAVAGARRRIRREIVRRRIGLLAVAASIVVVALALRLPHGAPVPAAAPVATPIARAEDLFDRGLHAEAVRLLAPLQDPQADALRARIRSFWRRSAPPRVGG